MLEQLEDNIKKNGYNEKMRKGLANEGLLNALAIISAPNTNVIDAIEPSTNCSKKV